MRIAPKTCLFLIVAAGSSLVGCGKDEAKAQGPAGADRPIAVTTTKVQQVPWSDTITALGTTKARESVTVSAKVSETVAQVHFESGDRVAKGAPLVTLTGQQQQASLAALEATAADAERLYKRQSELAAQQLIARASLDTQRAARDATRAQVAGVKANLADRVIRAPFAGVLGLRQVSPGTLVTPGTPIATLDDVTRVYVDFPVPEIQLANLARGQVLVGRSAAYPGRDFAGTVSNVDARVDAATRAVTVRGDFANTDSALRPGMLVEVRLARPERKALVVPEISVVQVGRDAFAFRVLPDGSVEQAPLKLGERVQGQVEVLEGVALGDRIVVDGTGKLRPGARIVEGKVDAIAPDAGAAPATPPTAANSTPRQG